jgi:GTP-binding protein
VEIRDVIFRGAALRASQRPAEWFPHVAVAGRSNVGKSSLLNWLLQRKLARVAKAPGKTRTLNFYLVNGGLYLVDLPGYGFAKVGRQLQQEWGRELERYLAEERRLAGVMTLIDIRHGPTSLDLGLQELLEALGVPRQVVLTKADKVGRSHRARMQREVQNGLGLARPPVTTSIQTGEGRRELLGAIDELVAAWRARDHKGE